MPRYAGLCVSDVVRLVSYPSLPSKLYKHVSQGLTLLEESVALSDESKSNEEQENQTDNGNFYYIVINDIGWIYLMI